MVACYKYLGIWLDDCLTFKRHVNNQLKKLRVRLGFFYRNKSCFSLEARKRLVSVTFLPVLDYGDLIYMNAPANCLVKLDAAYHSALRFLTNCKALTHHCTLYTKAVLPSLTVRRLSHWYIFIYKAMLDKLPSYICSLISLQIESSYCLRSHAVVLLNVPSARTVLGKKAFRCAAPLTWNSLQKCLKLSTLVPLHHFKTRLGDMLFDTHGTCHCE